MAATIVNFVENTLRVNTVQAKSSFGSVMQREKTSLENEPLTFNKGIREEQSLKKVEKSALTQR